jgi:hypothetical protein
VSTSIEDDDVRAELRRILNSPHFETSDRNRRFLEYVVEETLAGRAERRELRRDGLQCGMNTALSALRDMERGS